MVNPFNGVSRDEYNKLAASLTKANRERDDAKRETSALRVELRREIENAERLSSFAGDAVETIEILEQTLIERQIGAQKDPSLVLVANTDAIKDPRRHEFVPLRKRRRMAKRKQQSEETKRSALPTLKAELPKVPLSKDAREVFKAALIATQPPAA